MDEASAMEHQSHQKDELQTNDVIQKNNMEPDNQHDYSLDLGIGSMSLNAEFPAKPKRRTCMVGSNLREVLAEDNIQELESPDQKCCNQNGSSEKGNFWRAQGPFFLDHHASETRNSKEELGSEVSPRFRELTLADNDFTLGHHGALGGDFVDNGVVNSCDKDCTVNCPDSDDENIANSVLAKARDDGLLQTNKMPNCGQSVKPTTGFNSIRTRTSGCQDESGSNFKTASMKGDSLRGLHDVKKISDRLETFNKNNEMTNDPVKVLRPKIEETEMPTKGVVSNLKSLFEKNAVTSNNGTCKSASYKLEYGVGRSSGALNKGVFH